MEACKLSDYDSSETVAVAMGCLVTQSCALLFLSYLGLRRIKDVLVVQHSPNLENQVNFTPFLCASYLI